MLTGDHLSAQDWLKGIGLSLLASVIGGSSKLAIRKSWLLEAEPPQGTVSSDSSTTRVVAGPEHASSQQEEVMAYSGDFLLMGTEEKNQSNRPSSLDDLAEVSKSATAECTASIKECADDDQLGRSNGGIGYRSLEFFGDVNSATTTGSPTLSTHGLLRHHRRRQTRHAMKRRVGLAWCLRGMGMLGMTVFNPICCVLAMNYASPSILAPFSGLTLVWIAVFSRPALGEVPSSLQVIAASLIVLGEVFVAVFGDHTNNSEAMTVDDVVRAVCVLS
jgi:hypothetical protein